MGGKGGVCVLRESLTVLVPDEIEINKPDLKRISISVVIASQRADGFLTALSASPPGSRDAGEDLVALASEPLPDSPRLSALHLSTDELKAGLEAGDEETAAYLARAGVCREVEVDIGELHLEDGATSFVTVTAHAMLRGRRVRQSVQVPIRFSALPEVPGWYGGDGHVHTQWSPDVVLLPISRRVRYARNNGFGFIIITDHEDGVGEAWSRPGGYCAQCRAAEEEYGIPVLPGIEIDTSVGGHCLAYWLDEDAPSAPANGKLDARGLLREIERHNYPRSYGVVAHPFALRQKWRDWTVENFVGLEIINRSRKSSSQAVAKWFELLHRDLPRTLRTGKFVVGLANSDCHNLQEPGGRGFTWIRPLGAQPVRETGTGDAPDTPKRSTLTREDVWRTLRQGRAVASGSKDLGFFTLNGAGIGEIASAFAGSTLSFTFEWHPAGGRTCRKITLFSGDGGRVVLSPGRPKLPLRYETRCPRESTFYVAKFEFSGPGRSKPSEVWTNPVFLRVTGI